MNKTVKWILIAVAIIAALALIIFAIKYFSKPADNAPPSNNPPGGPSNTITDIFSALFSGNFFNNLFGGGKKCDPNKNCYQKNGDYNLQCTGYCHGN